MKKLCTMVLLFVLVLGLAAPALAYTTNTAPASGSAKYTLDIYLVDYQGNDFLSGMISKPAVDRGYAKNEIVAAVASLTVPKGEDVYDDGYRELVLSGKNASLYVTDNHLSGTTASLTTTFPYDSATGRGFASNKYIWDQSENEITHDITDPAGTAGTEIPAPSKSSAYRVLFFAKVTDDNASLSITLSKNADFVSVASATWTASGAFLPVGSIAGSSATHSLVLSDDYMVVRQANNNYIVFENNGSSTPGNPLFRIECNAKGKTERLYMYTGAFDGPLYRIHVEPSSRQLMFLVVNNVPGKVAGDQIKYGDSGYTSLRYFYDTHFEKGLGFTAFNEGNILTNKDFRTIANADDVMETVKIEPWTPHVSVPEVGVVNPPKTGSAADIAGFVLIAAALAGMIAVRKVRISGSK